MKQIMKCGCAANAKRKTSDGWVPSCVTHNCIEIASEQPNLEGRQARCGCGAEKASSANLPFFEYAGPGSREAEEICKCGYARVAHKQGVWAFDTHRTDHDFKSRGSREKDHYYCGHAGWD